MVQMIEIMDLDQKKAVFGVTVKYIQMIAALIMRHHYTATVEITKSQYDSMIRYCGSSTFGMDLMYMRIKSTLTGC